MPSRLDRFDDPTPHSRILSNGSYFVLVSGAGSGFSSCRGVALTGWSADRTEDGEGSFLYLRDLERGLLWSSGLQPTAVRAEEYRATSTPGEVAIRRTDHGIEATLRICVDPTRDVEVRRVAITNRSAEPRTIELTSYAEVVLQSLAGHRGHPAFSKLFVQTEVDPEAGVLLASRRPRGHSEQRTWLAQALSGGGELGYETDRVRFLGRGGSRARPRAMATEGPLSGTVGNVLDPVLALRRTALLAPGESAVFDLVLGAGGTREAVLDAVKAAAGEAEAVFARAAKHERALRRRLGVRNAEAERLQDLAGALLYADPRLRPDSGSAELLETALAYWQALGLALSPDALPVLPDVPAARRKRGTDRYRVATPGAAPEEAGREPLRFENGYGGFTAGGREYVIRKVPPMPWTNVIANQRFGFLVSETGAANTWSENSRENRLTPWSNDPLIDPHGEALYLRDEKERVFWSPLPGPVADGLPFEVRHGFGYTRWTRTSCDLEQEVVTFVPKSDPLKVTIVTLRNTARRRRRLSLFSYQQLVLGGLAAETAPSVTTEIDAASGVILARNPRRDPLGDRVTFAAAVTAAGSEPVHLSADRTSFLGRNGSTARPAALATARTLDGRAGAGLDPCAALQVEIEIPARGTVECGFLLGEAAGEGAARELIDRFRRPGALREALDDVDSFWDDVVSAIQVETPAPAIDLMVNGWLLDQLLGCRVWGRTALYQSGGAFGFRDQLQDSAALVYCRPDLTRAQIVLHAAHQFVEGDVLHWWHPPSDRGTRTRCSDDLLWLPYIATFYARTTGDWSVLDDRAGFVTARLLEPGEDEAYLQPSVAAEAATVYEHCCRAIDRSLAHGAHGLPLIGTCDWNDGMNRVGREGRGESIWLGFFLYTVLGDFLPVCERRQDPERASRYRRHREELREALETAGWDGGWYRRAYYDDGTPLGSAENEECRIDALAQSWAVISGAAPPERARMAMDAAERELVSERDGIIRLLTPPFDRTPQDPGYIKGYVPGIRENGGQYTHGALWVVRAEAELGRRHRAAALLEMLTPIHHALDRAAADRYAVEPYVVAADVYGASPHVGRGGWTWYTGSAGWMYRVALESVLGLTTEGGELVLKPCIPDAWPRYRIRYRLPDRKTVYEIRVENPTGRAEAVTSVTIDGQPGTVRGGAARIALAADDREHLIIVTLGRGAT